MNAPACKQRERTGQERESAIRSPFRVNVRARRNYIYQSKVPVCPIVRQPDAIDAEDQPKGPDLMMMLPNSRAPRIAIRHATMKLRSHGL